MLTVLVDGDVLLYRAAYATEYKTYFHPDFGTFRYKAELRAVLSCVLDEDEYTRAIEEETEIITVTEPISHSKQAVDTMVETIKRDCESDNLIIFVHDAINFRLDIPYPVTYKGNRPEKPSNYEMVRTYLISLPYTKLVRGIEVDDALGIMQDHETIIASVDKDLRQIPGKHYDIVKRDFYHVHSKDCYYFYWLQMLMGDRVDNIIGLNGIGPKRAKKILDGVTPDFYLDVVKSYYQEYVGHGWQERFEANQKLLKILTKSEATQYEYSIG